MNIHPLLTLLVLILLSVTGILVYRAVYRKKINQQLTEQRSTAHISMPPIGTAVKVVVMGLMLYMMYSTMTQLQEIAQMQEENTNSLNNTIRTLNDNVSRLQSLIEEENNIVSSIQSEFGEVNTENDTVELRLECVLKEYSSDGVVKATVKSGSLEREVELEHQSAGVYSGTVENYPLFSADYADVIIAVNFGDIIQTQSFESEIELPWRDKFGGNYYELNNTIEAVYEEGKIKISGDVEVYSEALTSGSGSYELVIYSNGKQLKTIPVSEQITQISEEMLSDARIAVSLRSNADYGYIFEEFILDVKAQDTSIVQYLHDPYRIFNKDGKLVVGLSDEDLAVGVEIG